MTLHEALTYATWLLLVAQGVAACFLIRALRKKLRAFEAQIGAMNHQISNNMERVLRDLFRELWRRNRS